MHGISLWGKQNPKAGVLTGDAIAQGAEAIITFGALQSNHVRQTIAACAKQNVPCHAILSDIVPHHEPAYRSSGNYFIDQFSHASVYVETSLEATANRFDQLVAELSAKKIKPYIIPTGGSSAVGALGYVQAALELGEQISQRGLKFDAIISASASGGTHSGFAVGLNSIAPDTPYFGVNVYNTDAEAFEQSIQVLRDEVVELLGVKNTPSLNFIHDFVGDGYGVPTEGMKEAVKALWHSEGVLLDPVYTGKAMSALIALCRRGRFSSDQKILFIHTGGAPALFAYADEFRNG